MRKEYDVVSVRNGSLALDEMDQSSFDVVVVNAASMRTSGKRICQSIQRVERENHIPTILIIDEESDPDDSYEADVVLQLPFTLQKLINRIRPFEPSDLKNCLEVGGLLLDEANRCIHFNGIQTSLTPRLIALLKILMEHPGEVIGREDIFRAVWETDFVADMRTLDVHISWLRQVIEEDARKPKIIKTVRGVGYKLVID
ncbi:MAG: response regulator transcription factor [Anaerolineae bacterium]|nr:response regulator transcription factor [Anaerolineae bacterium]